MAELTIRLLFRLSIFAAVAIAGDLHHHYHQEHPLLSEYYNEITCPKKPVPLFEGKIRYIWLFAPGRWYMPMASEKVYRQAAEILLGRPARSQAELDLLDPQVRGLLSAPRITGFGTKSFRKACVPINRPIKTFPRNLLEVTCFALWGTRGTDLESTRKGVDTINWTDNENAVLITPCVGHDFNWFVLTKRPTISAEAKDIILHRIAALGFDPHKANYYDYENKKFIKNHNAITKAVVVHEPEPEIIESPHEDSYPDHHEHEYEPSPNAVSFAPKSPFYHPTQSYVEEPHHYHEYQASPSYTSHGMYYFKK